LSSHSDYTGSYKSGSELVTLGGLPPILWGLKVVIAETIYASTDRIGTSAPTIAALWGDNCLICYIDPNPSLYGLTFMKTFVPRDGQLQVIKGDYESTKHGYDIQVYEECDEKVICAECGYLITNCSKD